MSNDKVVSKTDLPEIPNVDSFNAMPPKNGKNTMNEIEPMCDVPENVVEAGPYTPVSAPKRKSKKKSTASAPFVPTAVAAQRNEIAQVHKMLGNTASFKFYKVDKLGKLQYVNEYGSEDIKRVSGGDIEKFIQTYLLDGFGEGEYIVEGFTSSGEVAVKRKSYLVLSPFRTSSGLPARAKDAHEQHMTERLFSRLEKLEDMNRSVDPLEMLNKYKQVLGGGSDNLALLMMMMNNNKPNSEVQELKEELRELRRLASRPQPLPPPPVPAPPQTDLKDLILLLKPEKSSFSEIKDLALLLMPVLKDVFANRSMEQKELFNIQMQHMNERLVELRDQAGRDSLQETLENVGVLKEFLRSDPMENGGSFMKEVMSNLNGILDGISKVFAARASGQAPQLVANSDLDQKPNQVPEESPPLPESFASAISGLDNAETDNQRLEELFNVFKSLAESEHYRKIVINLITQLRVGAKANVLDIVSKVCQECVDLELLSEKSANSTIQALSDNFEEAKEKVMDVSRT